MEKNLERARNILNKIVKKLGRSDLDWTVQVSIHSLKPNVVNYCAQIEAPANGLQPITWIKGSWEELIEALKISEKGLDQEAVEKAWHEAEIERAKALIEYHEECLKSNES